MPQLRRGLMFVLSSPSGAGKTTLSRRLLAQQQAIDGDCPTMAMSVSVTTRPMRPGEISGRDYFFVEHTECARMIEAEELLEHAQVFDHHYGTPKHFVSEQLERGIDVLFDIDWQGTRQLAAQARADLVSVFILPPSMAELERRLRTRAQDSEEIVQRRMSKARDEISHWQEYDYVLVNDDLDATLARINAILMVERTKRARQCWLEGFISAL